MSPYRPTGSGCMSGKAEVRSVPQHLSHFVLFLMPRFLEFFSFHNPPRTASADFRVIGYSSAVLPVRVLSIMASASSYDRPHRTRSPCQNGS